MKRVGINLPSLDFIIDSIVMVQHASAAALTETVAGGEMEEKTNYNPVFKPRRAGIISDNGPTEKWCQSEFTRSRANLTAQRAAAHHIGS